YFFLIILGEIINLIQRVPYFFRIRNSKFHHALCQRLYVGKIRGFRNVLYVTSIIDDFYIIMLYIIGTVLDDLRIYEVIDFVVFQSKMSFHFLSYTTDF